MHREEKSLEYKDYYKTLNVERSASQDEIQKAYRKLARKYHPDLNRTPEAEGRFKDIGEAYEVLKDADKRKKYDRYGAAWKAARAGGGPPPGAEGFGFGGMGAEGFGFGGDSGFSSFFEMLFGGGGPGGPGAPGFEWPSGGGDQEATLALSLEEAARGGKREISISDPATGQRKAYTVSIPAGVKPGGRIRLKGKGSSSRRGGPPGDLYLKIEVAPHPRFQLEGSDLRTSIDVTPWEAALGGAVRLETLAGPVNVKVPAGSSSGRVIRLRGKGYPNAGDGVGDLLAEIRIHVPKQLTDEERELFNQLREVSKFEPRRT